MSKTLIALFAFASLWSFAQSNLPIGQGVLKIDYEKSRNLYFFADTNQTTPTKTIVIAQDKDGEYILKNPKQVLAWFEPGQLALDYSIFILRVDTIVGKWYKVVPNEEKAETMWTKLGPSKKFVKWSTFLLKETTAISKGFADLPIKTAPSETSKTIKKIETEDCFEALEIKGDWMKIRTNTVLDCNQSNRTIQSGWLKWKDKNRLTISFGLTC